MSPPVIPRRPQPARGGASDGIFVAVLAAAALAGGWFWLDSGVAGWVATGRWPRLPLSDLMQAAGRLRRHLGDPTLAWPYTGGTPGSLASTVVFYGVALAGLGVVVGVLRVRHVGRPAPRGRRTGAGWARPADLRPLRIRRGRSAARLVLGRRPAAVASPGSSPLRPVTPCS